MAWTDEVCKVLFYGLCFLIATWIITFPQRWEGGLLSGTLNWVHVTFCWDLIIESVSAISLLLFGHLLEWVQLVLKSSFSRRQLIFVMAFYCTESPLGQQGKTMRQIRHETLGSVVSWNMSLAIFLKKCSTFNVGQDLSGKQRESFSWSGHVQPCSVGTSKIG